MSGTGAGLRSKLVGGGATLFLAGEDHWRCEKAKRTRRYLLGHRRILKKGDFTTPPVNPIFQKENGDSASVRLALLQS